MECCNNGEGGGAPWDNLKSELDSTFISHQFKDDEKLIDHGSKLHDFSDLEILQDHFDMLDTSQLQNNSFVRQRGYTQDYRSIMQS